MAKRPTAKQKVEVYEDLLHSIQLYSEVTMNNDQIREVIRRICAWSYAHRSGNGELTEKEQNEGIDQAFWRLDLHKRRQPK